MPIIGCTKENNCRRLAYLRAKMLEEEAQKKEGRESESKDNELNEPSAIDAGLQQGEDTGVTATKSDTTEVSEVSEVTGTSSITEHSEIETALADSTIEPSEEEPIGKD
ncbi:uncharacterized protein LOC143213444 [Lasioglossum baleicum]|uniref:uncharacterized protein LOC143213444 n=1 Tax=Lasioglossum baleicum TaxID=434251 RepID=UPI003FCDD4D9